MKQPNLQRQESRKLVTSVLLGNHNSMPRGNSLAEAPTGCVLVSGAINENVPVDVILYLPVQTFRNGNWQTIEG